MTRRLMLLVALLLPMLSGLVSSPGRPASAAARATYAFDSGVCGEDRVLVKRGVELAQAFLADELGRPLQSPLVLDVTTDPPPPNVTAQARGHTIVVYVTAQGWKAWSAEHRMKILIHEVFHVWQGELAAGTGSLTGATWLLEGSAEYVGFRVAVGAGLFTAADVTDARVYDVTQNGAGLPGLGRLETPSDFYARSGPVYSLGALAVDRLVARSGVASLRAFYGTLGGGTPWRTAFANAFGRTTDAFYASFATYRANLETPPYPSGFQGAPPACTTTTPKLTLTPSRGKVGSTVGVSLSGYPKRQQITITWDRTTVATVTTSSTGQASASFAVPASSGGRHTVKGAGAVLSASATYTVVPSLTVSPRSLTVGQSLRITLRGFGKRESVTLKLVTGAGTKTLATATTSATGSATVIVAVPAVVGGRHQVEGVGAGGGTASAALTVVPSVALSRSEGSGGAPVSATVRGFAAGEGLTLVWHEPAGPTTLARGSASATGSAILRFAIPADASGGAHAVDVVGDGGSHAESTLSVVVVSGSPATATPSTSETSEPPSAEATPSTPDAPPPATPAPTGPAASAGGIDPTVEPGPSGVGVPAGGGTAVDGPTAGATPG